MRSFSNILASFFAVMLLAGCYTPKRVWQNETNNYKIDNSITADTAIVNYYSPFKQKLESEMNKVIGYSDNNLSRTRVDGESLAGNFFVDALLAIGKSIDSTTQIAFANHFGIRTDLKQGNVTIGNVFELMPFENSFTIIEISGKDLNTLSQYIAKTNGQPIAGMTLEIKDGKAINIKINNELINSDKTYKIITYDYLANGGDYVEGFNNIITRNDTGILVRFGLIDYIEKLTKAGKTINTKLDGRIKVIK